MRGGVVGKESAVVGDPGSAEDAVCSRLVDASLEEGARVGAVVTSGEPTTWSCKLPPWSEPSLRAEAVLAHVETLFLQVDDVTGEVDVPDTGLYTPCGRIESPPSISTDVLVKNELCGT